MKAIPLPTLVQLFPELTLNTQAAVLDQLHSCVHWMRPRNHSPRICLELAKAPTEAIQNEPNWDGVCVSGLERFDELAELSDQLLEDCSRIWRGVENTPLLTPLLPKVWEVVVTLDARTPREILWPLRHFVWHQRACGASQLVAAQLETAQGGNDIETWR